MAEQQPTKKPQYWMFGLSAIVLAVLLVTLLNIFGFGISLFPPWHGGPEAHRGIGQRLDFVGLEPLTGDPSPLSTADLQGHVVLLNFWGTWCPPCRAELPHMAALWQRFAGHNDFRLAAISCPAGGDKDIPALRDATSDLLKRLGLELPTYYDPDDKTRAAVDRAIGFEGFPTNVLLDRHGVIRAIWVGYKPGVEVEIEKYVDKLLSET